mmetsp:Transcript_38753/g.51060  ORF Transcript_38753/g.51060 Transcript_38753/m.51060 type:complete len:128 (+) Transcript_38753:46-429(+)
MAQGSMKVKGKKGKPNKKQLKKAKAHSKNQRERLAKKGNPLKAAKNKQRKLQALEQREITKAINRNNEEMLAAKAIQGGDTIHLAELRSKGKQMVKEIRRNLLKKKDSRIEEKLKKAKEKLGLEEES